ncbi:MAG TPA: YncE family protein [Patescibacteria group bacterium]|nr:YncE family protein [Patescibacteria group bacterium]
MAALVLAALAAGLGAAAPSRPLPLKIERDVPLPGRTTRFDYETIDPRTGLLFIAHLGDSRVLVFSTAKQELIGQIPAVADVHGVLAIASLERVYASATGRNEVVAIDERSLAVTARIPGGVYPDGLAYDPADRELFVSDEAGRTDTVIDTSRNRPVATIALGGEAGNTRFDPATGRMYVDVQTLDRLVAIDPKTRRIVASYPLPGCRHDHGLYIDARRRLALVACDGNAKLLTFDLRLMRVTGIASVGRDPDVLAFDASLGRLYVASESGVVAAFAEKGRRLVKLGQSYLAREAHSVAVDTEHRVYFPLQNVNGHPVLRIMLPAD